MSRNHSPNRCEECSIFKPLCVCALSPRLDLKTRVLILMHIREIPLTTNTARLAKLALLNSEIRLRGERPGEAPPLDCTDLTREAGSSETPARPALVLFPSEDARELTPEFARELKEGGATPVLVVPDGNWKQCSKFARRVPGLEALPRVKLPPGPPSEYVLRKEPRPECVSTYEAIARALGILEGAEVERRLMEYFRLKQDRLLWARGVLPAEKVRGGVPQAAIDSFFEAGRRGGPSPRE